MSSLGLLVPRYEYDNGGGGHRRKNSSGGASFVSDSGETVADGAESSPVDSTTKRVRVSAPAPSPLL